MRGWLKAVVREMRHGVCIFGALGMAVLLSSLLWTRSYTWGTRWNELGQNVREDMILLAPFAVVLGAWQAGRARRSEVSELIVSTRRSHLAWHSAEVVALGLALFLGVLLGFAGAAWTVLATGGYGTWVAAAYVVGALPALLAASAFGHVIGRLLPWRIVAPISGVLTYIALGFTLWADDKRPILFGGGWLGGVDMFAFDTDAWAWSLVVGIALMVVLIGVGAVEKRPARSTGWAGAAVAGLALIAIAAPSALAAIESGSQAYPRVRQPSMLCATDGGPKVCVLEADQHLLDEAVPQARQALRRLQGIAGAPTWAGPRINETDPTRLNIWAGDTTPWGAPADEVNAPVVSYWDLFSPNSCPFDPDSNGRGLLGDPDGTAFGGTDVVAQWLDGSPEWEPSAGDGLLPRFKASSDAQKREYAGRLLAAARACDPAAARAAAEALAR